MSQPLFSALKFGGVNKDFEPDLAWLFTSLILGPACVLVVLGDGRTLVVVRKPDCLVCDQSKFLDFPRSAYKENRRSAEISPGDSREELGNNLERSKLPLSS